MLKFVNGDSSGRIPKRQQTSKACSPCRKRKKRCHHHELDDTTQRQDSEPPRPETMGTGDRQSFPRAVDLSEPRLPTSDIAAGHLSPPSSITTPHAPLIAPPDVNRNDPPLSSITHVRDESLGARFVGDLNPESVFLAASSPDVTRGSSMEGSVGVWLRSTINKRLLQSGNHNPPNPSPSSLFFGSTSLVQDALLPLLQQECLSMLPPPQHLEALTKLYFERIHPIFPVIDMEEFKVSPATNCSILLQQAICLASSKNFAAAPHLQLPDSADQMTPVDFGDKITRAMRLSIEMGLVTDRVVLIQACALMSQFVDYPDGGDLASQFCARAVHNVHSIGLHVKIGQDEAREQYAATLLCCVWAIDRMNAAFNGRPVSMHDQDSRSDMRESFEKQAPAFRLYLQVIVLLDKIFAMYRPSAAAGIEYGEQYPSFEDLVVKCEADSVGTWALASIEVLYQVVTILSYRSKTLTETQRSSTSYLRQMHSTSTLASTIRQEVRDLTLFPFIPYGLSLALTITYREMRYGKISLHRSRSRTQFQTLSDTLFQLSDRFRSASRLAEMGQKLLKELDRVMSTVSKSKPVPQSGEGTSTPQGDSSNHVETPVITNILNSVDETQSFLQPSYEFNPLMFDPAADIDLFGMFDPAFNLDTFDAQWDNTLNPTYAPQF